MNDGPVLSFAAPCFNEADVIADVVSSWNQALDTLPFASEMVLCNDGSTDDTERVLQALCATYPRLRVVSFARNGGYGRALRAAIAATRGAYVATLDSDGQFDPLDAVKLYEIARETGVDCVAGHRLHKADSRVRVMADLGLRALVRGVFSVRVHDPNCALRVVRGDVLRGLRIESRGFITPTEMMIRLQTRGVSVREKGIEHRAREKGSSKLRVVQTAWDALWFLAYLQLQLRLESSRIIVAT